MASARKTVLITGSSSGIGRETAKLFQAKGWNVVATMRTPSQEKFLHTVDNVLLFELDVTKPESISKAVEAAISKFGGIDVVINNAGYGASGPFELTTEESMVRQYDTNVFGPMRVMKAVLPHFREKKSANDKHIGGTFVNISSIGGRLAFPLYSLYHGTKWALEGFSESVQYELEQFNIKIKLVEPGAIRTDFYTRSADKVVNNLGAYQKIHDMIMPNLMAAGESGLNPDKVALTIYKAATSRNRKLRYGVPFNTSFLLFIRRLLPDRILKFLTKRQTITRPSKIPQSVNPPSPDTQEKVS